MAFLWEQNIEIKQIVLMAVMKNDNNNTSTAEKLIQAASQLFKMMLNIVGRYLIHNRILIIYPIKLNFLILFKNGSNIRHLWPLKNLITTAHKEYICNSPTERLQLIYQLFLEIIRTGKYKI